MTETIPGDDAQVPGEWLAGKMRMDYATLSRLAQRGVVPRPARGRYPFYACIGDYIEHLREWKAGRAASDAGDDSPDLVRERALLARAQREGQDMKNAVLRGELLPVDDVEAVVGAVLDATRAKMQALPSKLAPRCVGLDGLAQARDILTAGVTEAYEELSNARVVAAAVDRARQNSGRDPAGYAVDEAAEASAASECLAVE